MVKAFYTSTDKRLPTELARIKRSLGDVQRPTGTEKNRSLLQIEAAIAALQDQQGRIEEQQSRLEDAAKVYSAATGNTHTGASWMPNTPKVQASSVSRRFRITVTGGGTGGATFFTFSAPGYNRDRALGGSAEAILSRVSVLGGAGDPGTAQRSWVVTMAGVGPYEFQAHARPSDQYASAIGVQIDVQPVL